MVTIIAVADHARRAYTSDDGIVIHDLVAPVLRRGESVVVSFKDVDAATTSFVNGAFIELLESFDFDFIKAHLRIVDSKSWINRMIKERFDFEVNHRQPPRSAE